MPGPLKQGPRRSSTPRGRLVDEATGNAPNSVDPDAGKVRRPSRSVAGGASRRHGARRAHDRRARSGPLEKPRWLAGLKIARNKLGSGSASGTRRLLGRDQVIRDSLRITYGSRIGLRTGRNPARRAFALEQPASLRLKKLTEVVGEAGSEYAGQRSL